MLAYQPVRSLAHLNIAIQQGLAGAEKFYQLLMNQNYNKENAKELKV